MAWHGSPQMDQEDLPPHRRSASSGAGSDTPQDAYPASAEGPGTASGGGPSDAALLVRLRALQDQVGRLVAAAEQAPAAPVIAEEIVPGAGTRIVHVPVAPAAPQLPPRSPAGEGGRTAAPDEGRHRRRAASDRRGPARERRARRDRRARRRHDPRPPAVRVERRVAAEDRRSGRGNRRLGHDRRSARRPRPAWGPNARRVALIAAALVELAVFAAGLIALLRAR
jgi:hypothetical protein